jgi:hypothetical protein
VLKANTLKEKLTDDFRIIETIPFCGNMLLKANFIFWSLRSHICVSTLICGYSLDYFTSYSLVFYEYVNGQRLHNVLTISCIDLFIKLHNGLRDSDV